MIVLRATSPPTMRPTSPDDRNEVVFFSPGPAERMPSEARLGKLSPGGISITAENVNAAINPGEKKAPNCSLTRVPDQSSPAPGIRRRRRHCAHISRAGSADICYAVRIRLPGGGGGGRGGDPSKIGGLWHGASQNVGRI